MEKAKNENDPRAGPGPQLITSGVQTSGIKSDNNRGVKRAAIAEWRRRWDVDRPALSGCSSQQPNMQSAGLNYPTAYPLCQQHVFCELCSTNYSLR